MGKYTMTIKEILECGYNIFDFNYPMIAGHRKAFEKKFLDYYRYHEINFHSVDKFKQRLNSKLNVIMPYYIQLYKSEYLIKNPLSNYRIQESYDRLLDMTILKDSLASGSVVENSVNRNSKLSDLKTNDKYVEKETGVEDGTLDRDNTISEKEVFNSTEKTQVNEQGTKNGTLNRTANEVSGETSNSNEDVTENTKTKSETITNNQQNISEDVTKDVTKSENTTEDNVKNVENSLKQNVTYDENTHGTKNTLFSDTPQVNFVIGNSDPVTQEPISSYATTLTNENTTGDKNSNQNTTGSSTEKTTEDKSKNISSTEKSKDKRTQDTITTENKEFTENVDRTQNTTFDSTTNKNVDSTLHDITHDEHEVTTNANDTYGSERNLNGNSTQDDSTHSEVENNKNSTDEFISHSTGSEQTQSDKNTLSVDKGSIKSDEKANTKYLKDLRGYKLTSESQLLNEFRKTFINIDLLILEQCNTLFIGVY